MEILEKVIPSEDARTSAGKSQVWRFLRKVVFNHLQQRDHRPL